MEAGSSETAKQVPFFHREGEIIRCDIDESALCLSNYNRSEISLEIPSSHILSAQVMEYPKKKDMWSLKINFIKSCGEKSLKTSFVTLLGAKKDCQAVTVNINGLVHSLPKRKKSLLVIVNPVSGRKKGLKVFNSILPLLQLANIKTELFVTKKKGDATELFKDKDLSPFDGVVLVGGDGTYYEVLNGLLTQAQNAAKYDLNLPATEWKPSPLPVGIIPSGTGNGIAEYLVSKDPVTATLAIIIGKQQEMTTYTIHQSSGKFLTFGGLLIGYGFFSDVIYKAENKRNLGVLRYPVYMLWGLFHKRFFKVHIKYEVPKDAATVANGGIDSTVENGGRDNLSAVGCKPDDNSEIDADQLSTTEVKGEVTGENMSEAGLGVEPKWSESTTEDQAGEEVAVNKDGVQSGDLAMATSDGRSPVTQDRSVDTPSKEAETAQDRSVDTPSKEAETAQDRSVDTASKEAETAQDRSVDTPSKEAETVQDRSVDTASKEAETAQDRSVDTASKEAETAQDRSVDTASKEAETAQDRSVDTASKEAETAQDRSVDTASKEAETAQDRSVDTASKEAETAQDRSVDTASKEAETVQDRSVDTASKEAETAQDRSVDTPSKEAETVQDRSFDTPSKEAETVQDRSFDTPSKEAETVQDRSFDTPSKEAETVQDRSFDTPSKEAETVQDRSVDTPSKEAETVQDRSVDTPSKEAETVQDRSVDTPSKEAETVQDRSVDTPSKEAETAQDRSVDTASKEAETAQDRSVDTPSGTSVETSKEAEAAATDICQGNVTKGWKYLTGSYMSVGTFLHYDLSQPMMGAVDVFLVNNFSEMKDMFKKVLCLSKTFKGTMFTTRRLLLEIPEVDPNNEKEMALNCDGEYTILDHPIFIQICFQVGLISLFCC